MATGMASGRAKEAQTPIELLGYFRGKLQARCGVGCPANSTSPQDNSVQGTARGGFSRLPCSWLNMDHTSLSISVPARAAQFRGQLGHPPGHTQDLER